MIHPIKHFLTISKHKAIVFILCVKAGIPLRGVLHDLSKYSPTEFLAGAKYYQGNRSPNEMEREAFGYSKAWIHHKGRNKHHFEYWKDYNFKTRVEEPVLMPIKFVKEMFCDRVAASKIYLKDKYNNSAPLEYFLKGKPTRIIHPESSNQLEEWLVMLKQKGENETFKYIKNIK